MVLGAVELVARPPEVGLQADRGTAVVAASLLARTLGVVPALVLTVAAVCPGPDGRTTTRLGLCWRMERRQRGEVGRSQPVLDRVRWVGSVQVIR